METVPPFVEAFITLHAFDTAAFPVDETIVDYLVDHGVIEDDTSVEEAQSFLEHAIKADDVYGSYLAIREAALGHERKMPRRESAKKK